MKKTLLALAIAAASLQTAMAAELSITVTNLTHGSHFTPLLISAHPDTIDMFEVGSTASSDLQKMAEGGDTADLVTTFSAVAANNIVNPFAGALPPGISTSADLTTDTANTQLSVVAMVLPSNDGFMGLDSITIPTTVGTYTYYLNAYDAGTEINDEIINGGGALGVVGIPVDPLGRNGTGATGVTSTENNQTIHIHRGVVGDTDAVAGASDLDSRVHRWLNPVAKVVLVVK